MASLSGMELGKYRIGERIGRGGMAEVYMGVHTHLDRQVAIKVLHGHLLEGGDFVARFKREAKAVAALRHPNIVQVYDFDVQDEIIFMVMEYIEGTNLQKRLVELDQKGERLPITTIGSIIHDIAGALDYAHSKEMLHRDVKPSNILLDKNDKAYLTDFGIARLLSDQRFTATGTLVGTPAYMSPEQGMGEELTRESDIYSLGVVAFELITGQVPYDAQTPIAIVQKQISEPIPDLRKYVDDMPESAQGVIDTALAKSPTERYSSAEALVFAIRNALQALESKAPSLKTTATPASKGKAIEFLSPTVEMQDVPPSDELEQPTVVMKEETRVEKAAPELPAITAEPAPEEVEPKPGDRAPVETRPSFFSSTRNRILGGVAGIVIIIGVIFGVQMLGGNKPSATPESGPTELSPQPGDLGGEDYFDQGTFYMGKDSWVEAIESFDLAVRTGFEIADLHHLKAIAYTNLGNPDEAIASWTRAIELDSEVFEYWRERGIRRFEIRDLPGAMEDITHSLDLKPDDVQTNYALALVQKEMGNFDAALEALDRAVELWPENGSIHSLRGQIYWLGWGDQAKAEAEFTQAVHFAGPDDPGPYNDRALFFVWTDRCNLAVIDYTTYIELVQDNPRVYQERGDCYAQLGKSILAGADYQTFLALSEGNPEFKDMRLRVETSLAMLPPQVGQVFFDPEFVSEGILLLMGGDVDTGLVTAGPDQSKARRTGNGEILSSEDGNTDQDFFMGFDVIDDLIFQGSPSTNVLIEVEYLDDGLGTFNLQYDSITGDTPGEASFRESRTITKGDSGEFKVASFTLNDAFFGNRTNGGDFRISDATDGAEIIRRVAITLLPPE